MSCGMSTTDGSSGLGKAAATVLPAARTLFGGAAPGLVAARGGYQVGREAAGDRLAASLE